MNNLVHVDFYNDQDLIKIDKSFQESVIFAIQECLKSEDIDVKCQIDVMFTDNEKIRCINNEYRSIDKPTDVLSFPLANMQNGEILSLDGDVDLESEYLLLGDIIISLEKAEEQAIEYGHSFKREVLFLITHGVYHLLGYDHSDDSSVMFDKQEKILKLMGVGR